MHPFGDAPPLVLGGVTIADAPRLAGHSDGDAVAHAVADALLGPAGLPDLGTLFPATDEQYRGADSMELLAEVAAQVAHDGWWIENVDVDDRGGDTEARAARGRRWPRTSSPRWRRCASRWAAGSPCRCDPSGARDWARSGAAEGIAVWAVALLSGG